MGLICADEEREREGSGVTREDGGVLRTRCLIFGRELSRSIFRPLLVGLGRRALKATESAPSNPAKSLQ